MPETNARTNLRKVLMNLRQSLGPRLQIARHQIAFNQAFRYRLDVAVFETNIAQLKTDHTLTEININQVAQATELYTADFLEGFYVREAALFETWASAQQMRLRELLLTALRAMTNYYARQQTPAMAIDCARRLLALEPFDEGAERALMLVLAQTGQRSAALAQYETWHRLLEDELDVEPTAETIAVFRAIQSDDFAHLAAWQDLQSQPDQAVVISSFVQSPSARKPLPSYNTPFVGRQKEVAEIESLLTDANCRLLTLVGPGGIGKTRLAIDAAQRFALPDGVPFVPLQPLASPDFVVPAIADAVNFQFYGSADPRRQLIDYLRDQSLLLVLDNFEHLLDAAALLSEILADAPGVRMLVTSRERLNLVEEWVLDVEGLAYPSSESETDLESYGAVELFVQHARRVKASFALTNDHLPAIIRICRLVEGIPLGIELAATWVRSLSCAAIADEIEQSLDILETPARNVEPRHRTMRAAFEPSWKRLSEGEREGFMRLSVFRGGCTREAAEEVAAASLHTLTSLVDKSLLQVDADGRYNIHELLRQYGEEQLSASAEKAAQTRDRHCHYYALFLEQRLPRLNGSGIKAALAEIDLELENVRAAWAWALRQRKANEIETALPSLDLFYDVRARYHEGEQAYAQAAAVFSDGSPESTAIKAKLQARQGAFCHDLGLTDKSSALLKASVEVLRRTEAYSELAATLHRLGVLYEMIASDLSVASSYYHESITIYEKLGDRLRMARVLQSLTYCFGIQGALERAIQCGRECLALFEQLGSLDGISGAYRALGVTLYVMGEYEQCKQYCEKSLTIDRETGSVTGVVFSSGMIAAANCALSEYAPARRAVLEGLQKYLDSRLIKMDRYTLGLMTIAACVWLGDGEVERGYELLASIEREYRKFGTHRRYWTWSILDRLDDELPPNLAAAAERGRIWNIEDALQALVDDFSRYLEGGAPALSSGELFTDALTKREREILQLLANGRTNREIANALFLAPSTVKWYVSDILDKLDVSNRTEASIRARELGILA